LLKKKTTKKSSKYFNQYESIEPIFNRSLRNFPPTIRRNPE